MISAQQKYPDQRNLQLQSQKGNASIHEYRNIQTRVLLSWQTHKLCSLIFLKEKGSTSLHVAAKAGQIQQAELLAVYGADPGTPDSAGKTPIDYAR